MQLSQEFINKMHNLLGEESSKFFESLNQPAIKGITVNYNAISRNLFEEMADFQHTPVPEVSNGYIVNNLKFGNHILSHLGIIYSQEPSAMYPVEMLEIEEGDIVLDLCASPGGKSLQILEKLKGSGFLVSNEIVYNRAKILYENLSKSNYKNFAITCNSPSDYEKSNLMFDKIIVDAPCGGEGMFRKNDFDFNAYNNSSIESNAKRQISILNSIKGLLKKGGKLLYSTCTYDIRENEDVVGKFAQENNFEILPNPRMNDVTSQGLLSQYNDKTIHTRRRYPHIFQGEGQFMALLCNNNDTTLSQSPKMIIPGYDVAYKKDMEILTKAFKGVANIADITIVKRNDNYYALPKTHIDLTSLNVVTIGTLMGSINKGVFKIAHEFYRAYSENFLRKFELNDNQVVEYLKGYEIDLNADIEGLGVVTYHNLPLGGGKAVNNKIKNYYPKHLRIN